MSKYEIIKESAKEFNGTTLYRIKALMSFGDVSAGDIGGWIEKETNLSHEGNAWVFGDAWVFGNARVSSSNDYLSIGPIGSESGNLTAFRRQDGSIFVNRGCFSGTIDDFEQKNNKRHGDNQFGEEYRLVIALIKLRLKEAVL